MKWDNLNKSSVVEKLNVQVHQDQALQHAGLLKQLLGMKYLLRQGIALRGHLEN